MLAQAPVALLIVGPDDRIAFTNGDFDRLLGWSSDRWIGHPVAMLFGCGGRLAVPGTTEPARPGQADLAEVADRLLRADGGWQPVRLRWRRVSDPQGREHRVSVVLPDGPVQASGAPWYSRHEWYQALFEDATMPMSIQDSHYRLVQVNRAYEQWIGYSRDELIGRDPIELTTPDLHSQVMRERTRDLSGHISGGVAHRRLRHRNGRDLHARLHFRVIGHGDQEPAILVAITDISADLELQRRLAQQIRRMEQFFEFAPVGLMISDRNQRIDRINRAFSAMTGYSDQELRGRDASLVPRGDEPSRVAVEAAAARAAREPGAVGRARVPLLTRDGRPVFTDRVSTSIEDIDGEPMLLTVVTDITAEQKLEQELRDVVLQQGALLRTMSSGVMMLQGERVVRCNVALESMLGLEAGKIIGRSVADVLDCDPTWGALCALAGGPAEPPIDGAVMVRVRRPEGTIVCAMQVRPVDPESPGSLIVTLQDITEIQAQQDRLMRANAELGALVDNTAVAVAYLEGGRFVRCNRPMQSLLGEPADALIGQSLSAFGRPEQPAFASLLASLTSEPRHPSTKAIRLVRRDGVSIDCLMHLGPVIARNVADASIVVAIDISGQQAALSALAATQERFGRFAEAVDEAVFVIDSASDQALFANQRFEQVLGVSADEFLLDARVAWRHLAEGDRARVDRLLAAALAQGHQETETPVTLPDGRTRIVRLRFFPARLGSAEIYCLAEDVTDIRNVAERRLQEAIRQKDTLVREVHHRIKNNLQGVAGLLQQSAARRPEIAPQLDEIVGQIQAIAQVHGLQVRDKGDLPLARLVLAVVESLSRGFGVTIGHALRTDGELQHWRVPEQEAVPVALVVNELCTNAIKHREPGSALVVELTRVDQSLVLSVANPGALPSGFALERYEPSPSGLGLIKALLPRRGTRLSMHGRDGWVIAELRMWPPVVRLDEA